ncbi:MAG: FtsX-like permease family protein [Micromonosporaceae bacterium]
MASLVRLRAHVGLWSMVALLSAAVALVLATAAPATRRLEDRALRDAVAAATYVERDIIVTRRDPSVAGGDVLSTDAMQGYALRLLPETMREVTGEVWSFQRTTVSTFEGVGASLTGDGLRSEPDGFASVVALHHQPGLEREFVLTQGRLPRTDVDAGRLEVVAAEAVAERLGMTVGRDYLFHAGDVTNYPDEGPDRDSVPVRLVGVFTPRDPSAPVWDHAPLLLEPTTVRIPGDNPPPATLQATLVTDADAFTLLAERQLVGGLRPRVDTRIRFDAARLDASWPAEATAAVLQVLSSPVRTSDTSVTTLLPGFLEDFTRRAAAARALIAVTGAGIVGTLVGLLALTALLVNDRRREELRLLRARGGSLLAVGRRLLAEGLWLVPPAVAAAWLAGRTLGAGRPPSAGAALAEAASAGPVAAALLLIVPVAGVAAVWRTGSPAAGRRWAPARVTAELSVVVLAGLGVVLLHQRGLTLAGVDPYLSAVPVLLAVATGVVALRLYPLPLRAVAAYARRLRGAVLLVGSAQSGRAANRPAAGGAAGLVVLVLAVVVGGFAGAVNTGVAVARDVGAARIVGAHVRVTGQALPEEAAARIAEVPGVQAVAVAGLGGAVLDVSRDVNLLDFEVFIVDAIAYEQVLTAVDVLAGTLRLPPEWLSASPDTDPVPVLTTGTPAGRDRLVVRVGERDYPVTVVGEVAGIPGLDPGFTWMVVPRQALPDPGEVNELLVAGAGVDPDAVRAAVAATTPAGDLRVSSLEQERATLEASGFNAGLTIVFVAATVACAVGAVLALLIQVILQAARRGRTVSVLRTLGMSGGQARALLLAELLPPVAIAIVVGGTVGAVLPLVLAPALGLDAFAAGVRPPVTVGPTTLLILAGLLVTLAAAAVVTGDLVNRRLGLGNVLRVG